ncbi:hypothetical protein C8R45DRAFT_1219617 [Mycena sanguinolenta]|nr:hypothetical protein C8R45DRAFT_1219617 [Mycena sanguinolenta]
MFRCRDGGSAVRLLFSSTLPTRRDAAERQTTNTKPHDTDAKIALDKPTFCGTITTVRVARERRERRLNKPWPWLVRKLTVVLTVGIMGYAGRFAVRLMSGGRVDGLGVIITPPGTANDYISKTPQPLVPRANTDTGRLGRAHAPRHARSGDGLLPRRTTCDFLRLCPPTQVESLAARRLREREDAALVEAGVPWWDVG